MKNKLSIKIQFPNLLLMPLIAVIASTCKLCGASCTWIEAIIVIPISLYFLWCIGYVGLMIMTIWLYRVWRGDNKK